MTVCETLRKSDFEQEVNMPLVKKKCHIAILCTDVQIGHVYSDGPRKAQFLVFHVQRTPVLSKQVYKQLLTDNPGKLYICTCFIELGLYILPLIELLTLPSLSHNKPRYPVVIILFSARRKLGIWGQKSWGYGDMLNPCSFSFIV